MLDAKEYPLALKPTPDELKKISYDVDGQGMGFFGDEFRASPPRVSTPFLLLSRKSLTTQFIVFASGYFDTFYRCS